MRIESVDCGTLTLLTGLHIGEGKNDLSIGGVNDLVVTRTVNSDKDGKISYDRPHKIVEPYIPGSSLKGKLRSLLEHYFLLIDPQGEGEVVNTLTTFGDQAKRDLIIKLFGEAARSEADQSETKESMSREQDRQGITISRAIFRDLFITNEIRRDYIDDKIELFEVKSENSINRKNGKAQNPRFFQRVVPGIEFALDINLRIFDEEEKELMEETLKLGLKLLELDALGHSGSRGYGRVRFSELDDVEIATLSSNIDTMLKSQDKKPQDDATH